MEVVKDDENESLSYLTALEYEYVNALSSSSDNLGLTPAAKVHPERFKRALIQAHLNKPRASTTLHDYFRRKGMPKEG